MRISGLLLSGALLASSALADGYMPPRGFVPDNATAIAIARAVLTPIYGVETIKGEEPLVAKREGDIWIIVGTLCGGRGRCVGGTAMVKLSAKDGRVLYVMHGE